MYWDNPNLLPFCFNSAVNDDGGGGGRDGVEGSCSIFSIFKMHSISLHSTMSRGLEPVYFPERAGPFHALNSSKTASGAQVGFRYPIGS